MNFLRLAIRVALKQVGGAPVGLGHGWWIMPDGVVVDVPYGTVHASVAETLIDRDKVSDEWSNEMADDILIDQGGIAIRFYSGPGGFSVTVKDLNDQNFNRIIELVSEETDRPDRHIDIEETSTRRFRQYEVIEFLEFNYPSQVWRKQYAMSNF